MIPESLSSFFTVWMLLYVLALLITFETDLPESTLSLDWLRLSLEYLVIEIPESFFLFISIDAFIPSLSA